MENDIEMYKHKLLSFWRLDIHDIEGRIYEIRDGDIAILRFANIEEALEAWDSQMNGRYEWQRFR